MLVLFRKLLPGIIKCSTSIIQLLQCVSLGLPCGFQIISSVSYDIRVWIISAREQIIVILSGSIGFKHAVFVLSSRHNKIILPGVFR